MALRLRQGLDIPNALEQVGACLLDAQNLAGGSAGGGWSRWEQNQEDYLRWIEMTEVRLRGVFSDPSVWADLLSDSFWHIRGITSEKPRSFSVLRSELQWQIDRIQRLHGEMKRLVELASGGAVLAVIDTNVLLHFQPPDQVKWSEIVGASRVRLVIPLRVLEELDEKKYTERSKLAARARSVLSLLRRHLDPGAGEPAELSEFVTVEVPVPAEPRRRVVDADQEILEEATSLQAAGGDVRVVTGDSAMTLRARALGLGVVDMPTQYARVLDQGAGEGADESPGSPAIHQEPV